MGSFQKITGLKIKVCGIKYPDNMTLLTGLGPDYIGLIRYPGSPRYVGREISDLIAAMDKGELDDRYTRHRIRYTGVYVDAPLTDVIQDQQIIGLGAVQLHGSEQPDYCRQLRQNLITQREPNEDIFIIKAFGISADFDWKLLEQYSGLADLFLFDTKTQAHGGAGRKFDWSLLDGYKLDVPYFLSGGIGPQDISHIIEMRDERLYGVDLNSRFETEPGMKDIDLLKETFIKLRNEQVSG